MRIGLYAGSFDPVTRGHEDVIRRSLAFVDQLVVAVATNVAKKPLLEIEERKRLIALTLEGVDRVEIHEFDGLLVDFARALGATMSIRGLRAVSDFEYEYQMALMNRHLMPSLETLFMVPSVDLTFISSSLVREIARFGGDLSTLVHPEVARTLRERYATP